MDAELRDKIERRAYELWEADGRPEGRDMHYWIVAEAEVTREVREGRVEGTLRGDAADTDIRGELAGGPGDQPAEEGARSNIMKYNEAVAQPATPDDAPDRQRTREDMPAGSAPGVPEAGGKKAAASRPTRARRAGSD